MKTLEQHYIAKIEGHGYLKTDLRKNKVNLIVDEGERYFERLVVGRRFEDAPYITSRICGVCPIAHQLAAIKAVEAAFGIEVNDTILAFRRLLMSAQIIQSHTLHLYFLALPDYLGLDSSITLADKNPKKLRDAFDLKHFADEISEAVGGKAIHPTTPAVGGFRRLPKRSAIKKIRHYANLYIDKAKMTIELFTGFSYPPLSNLTEYLSLYSDTDSYDFYSDKIISNIDTPFEAKDYKRRIKEKTKPQSSAKFSLHHGKKVDRLSSPRPFMTGALARINNSGGKLMPKAKIEKGDYFKDSLPIYNPFHNNVAQAIEILHSLEKIIYYCDLLLQNDWEERMVQFKPRKGTGVGAVEAPRGILYHYARTDSDGNIVDYDIIPPTAQNLSNLEADGRKLIKTTGDLSSLKRKQLLEMLIRAYDPCITCSVH